MSATQPYLASSSNASPSLGQFIFKWLTGKKPHKLSDDNLVSSNTKRDLFYFGLNSEETCEHVGDSEKLFNGERSFAMITIKRACR